jgi:hypothetical protein
MKRQTHILRNNKHCIELRFSKLFKKVNWIVPFIYSLLLMVACTSSEFEPDKQVVGFNYFPLLVGNYVDYEVDETIYISSALGVPEIRNYQIREEITQIFIDIEGERSFKIERSKRNSPADDWAVDSIWVAKIKSNFALKTENNISFVKLSFPPKNGLKWNGNAYNSLGEDTYEITNNAKPLTINDLTFDKTLTVLQADDSSRVSLDRRSEVYAEGIGLISKEYNQVFYCQGSESNCCEMFSSTVPGLCSAYKISFGRIIKQKIIGYGTR